jgi:hypothetical protein
LISIASSAEAAEKGDSATVHGTLKLVTRYDAGSNEYTVFRHNLTPEEADEVVRELSARLFGLFVIDQHAEHSAAEVEQCEACRRDVEHTSHVQPKPMPKRRPK